MVALTLMFAMYLMISNSSSLGMAIICMVNSTAFETKSDISLLFLALINHLALSTIITRHRLHCNAPIQLKKILTSRNTRHETRNFHYIWHILSINPLIGTLEWEPAKKSYLFSASYYGAICTVFVSGIMADRYGPKRLLLISFTISTILTLAAPLLAQFDYWAYFVARFIIGMGDGFVVPCINSLGGWWFPATEKSSMAALYISGVQLAAGSSSLIGSRLCEVEFMGGWPLIFYLYGSLGVMFLVCFYVAITDHPSDNKWLSKEELIFLESTHEDAERKKVKFSSIPWKSILTSPAVYACVLCNFTFSFVSSMNSNFLPSFFKEELALPLSTNGLYTMVPFFSQLFFKNVFAYAADYAKRSGRLTPTQTVKTFQALGSFGSAIAYICLAFLPTCERTWIALVCAFIFGLSFSSGVCGFFTCIMTIAPAYAGTITSLAMIFGQIGSALSANTVSFITYMEWNHKWQIILLFGASLQFISGVVFMIAGSGDQAPWARRKASLAMQKTQKKAVVEMQALTENH
uniref:MFS domain-containing protein n=1 Tax=Pristionchus pacificus TaxID=54126 RepID=A0A8R1UDD3_PRIPA